jgi:hypothetical protein
MTDSYPPQSPAPVFHADDTTVSKLTFDGPKGPLFKAMAEARKLFKPLTTSATADVQMKSGGKYQFSYAPLDVVLDALEPGLSAAGIALMQPFDGDTLFTIVACGESSMTIETPLPTWSTPQELGSLLTYLRRYQVKGVFGVADSEDDDGNAASGNKAGITRKEPTAPKAQSSLSKPLLDKVVELAKTKELSGAEFAKLVQQVSGKGWKDCNDADAQKILDTLEAL